MAINGLTTKLGWQSWQLVASNCGQFAGAMAKIGVNFVIAIIAHRNYGNWAIAMAIAAVS